LAIYLLDEPITVDVVVGMLMVTSAVSILMIKKVVFINNYDLNE
jgi:hypothetical protein